MNSKFTHYLITRYNVRLDQWDTDQSGQPTRAEEWMRHRFELFSRYCFPSVTGQSVKDFQWLLYLEHTTPEEQLQPIRLLVAPYPFIQLRLVQGYFGCMDDIDEQLSKATTDYVITSRLDNDDGLGNDFIKTVQSRFIPQDKALINLLHGHSYNPTQQVATRLHNIRRNHFSSFIEEHRSRGGHISVRGFPHGNPPTDTSFVEVNSQNSWLKIFHERNLLSSPFGYPVFTSHFSSQYGIDPQYLKLNLVSTLSYAARWLVDGMYRKSKKIIAPKDENK